MMGPHPVERGGLGAATPSLASHALAATPFPPIRPVSLFFFVWKIQG